MSEEDKLWQRVPKSRRAQVYRAFGQRIRDARLEHDSELAADMRVAFGVLRAHAKPKKTAKKKTTKRRR
jgi:hypothetical protein